MHTPALAHVVNTFRFAVTAPFDRVSPMFAPETERTWAGKHWNPVFAWPQPGKDVQGAVFTVAHGPHTSTWITTLFDVHAGRMQYVSIIDQVVATIVDVHVTATDPSHTAVEVTYSRTALDAAHNDDVTAMGESDLTSGPDWQHSIEAALHLAP